MKISDYIKARYVKKWATSLEVKLFAAQICNMYLTDQTVSSKDIGKIRELYAKIREYELHDSHIRLVYSL